MKTRIVIIALLVMSAAQINAQTIMNIYQSDGTVIQIPVNTIDSITYTILDPGNLATITTLPVENITSTYAVTGGNISNAGGTPITQRGVCWSTNPNPTTADNTTSDGSGTGSFSSSIAGLAENTTYYVRAYAINSAGTAYGNELNFTTSDGGGGIVSNPGPGVTFNGYTYSSVILGNGQEWMAENLRTTNYANGDLIPNVTVSNEWLNLTTGALVHYNNDGQYQNPYGMLYNWYTVNDSRNVCPTGWHVPSDVEWTALRDYLGGQSVAGGKMKSIGTQYWQSPNTEATNESGFSGLPGGHRQPYGEFDGIEVSGLWWSSTESSGSGAWFYSLNFASGNLSVSSISQGYGLSVRCLKD